MIILIIKQSPINEQNTEIETIQQQAKELSKEYDKQIDETSNYDDPLAGIMPMEKYYSINVEYQDVASGMNLPIFYTKASVSIFSEEEWIPLEKSMLTKGFKLSTQDSNVDFIFEIEPVYIAGYFFPILITKFSSYPKLIK